MLFPTRKRLPLYQPSRLYFFIIATLTAGLQYYFRHSVFILAAESVQLKFELKKKKEGKKDIMPYSSGRKNTTKRNESQEKDFKVPIVTENLGGNTCNQVDLRVVTNQLSAYLIAWTSYLQTMSMEHM